MKRLTALLAALLISLSGVVVSNAETSLITVGTGAGNVRVTGCSGCGAKLDLSAEGLAGGVITDRLVRRMPRFRIGFQVLAMLCGAPCLVAIGFLPTAAAMVAMTAAYGVFRGLFEVNTHATLFDVIPARYRSTSVGVFTVFAFLFGGLSGIAMGALSQRYGVRGFEIGFAMMGGAYVVGALCMMVGFFFTFRRDRIVE